MIFISNRAISWQNRNVIDGGRYKKRTGNIEFPVPFESKIPFTL